MTYNTDVGIEEFVYNVYEMIMGQAPDGTKYSSLFLMRQDWRIGIYSIF